MRFLKKKSFRLSEILFITGIIISAFVLINTTDVLSRIRKENKAISPYKEEKSICIEYTGDEISDEECESIADKVIESAEKSKCGVSVDSLNIVVNRQIDDMFAELVLKNISQKNEIISIGESVRSLTKNQEGAILNIGGHDVPVSNIRRNDNPTNIDYSIKIFLKNCDESFREYLKECICREILTNTLLIKFYDDSPIENSISEFVENIESYGDIQCSEYSKTYSGNDYQNYWYRFYNNIFISVCIIFSVLTCFSLSELWLLDRKKEIAVRKAYGYSNLQVFSLLFLDSLKLGIPAVAISLLIELFYCLITHDTAFFDIYFLLKMIAVFLGISVVVFACVLNLVRKISDITPVSVLREE